MDSDKTTDVPLISFDNVWPTAALEDCKWVAKLESISWCADWILVEERKSVLCCVRTDETMEVTVDCSGTLVDDIIWTWLEVLNCGDTLTDCCSAWEVDEVGRNEWTDELVVDSISEEPEPCNAVLITVLVSIEEIFTTLEEKNSGADTLFCTKDEVFMWVSNAVDDAI